jgi:hypothetical protein
MPDLPSYLHPFLGSLGRAIGDVLARAETRGSGDDEVTILTCRVPLQPDAVKLIQELGKQSSPRLRIKRVANGLQLHVTRA